jgi:uncharacterized membrane protein (DUF441 family)
MTTFSIGTAIAVELFRGFTNNPLITAPVDVFEIDTGEAAF